ncbi:SusC/RagA family TonB-linked outer membrane protein [Bacteroidia bacterium]|nr:SusC/RagA family TonB-linked outer membrane protein [Bacteroidia bacterium]
MKESKCMKEKGEDNSPKCNLLRNVCKMKQTIAFIFIFIGCLSFGKAYSQEIKGRVVDDQGEPLIGASIRVVDGKEKIGKLSLGTITNTNGEYVLQIPNVNFSLEFTYLGYIAQVIPLSNTNALAQVVLKENTTELSEVVITGMTKIDKRLFTGASDRLIADDVRISGISEIGRSLEGRAAGVSVQNISGVFGSGPRITVRGATSIKGDSKPLWVVDGIIISDVAEVSSVDLASGDAETLISSVIAGLNASDIESFTVLKDGSATSIYGAQAMAGVFVVTTKKGKSGQSSISYSTELTSRAIPTYKEYNIMNSQDQMDIYRELEQKGWLNYTNRYRAMSAGIYGKMYQMMNTYDPESGRFLLDNTDIAKNAYLREAEMRNTDWFDELFSTAIDQVHSLSISGGNDKTNYYGSLSAKLDPGWAMQSKVRRYTANMNLMHNIYKNLSLNIITRGFSVYQTAPGTSTQEVNSVFSEVSRQYELNPFTYALRTSRAMDPDEYYTRDYAPFNLKNELQKNYMERNELNLLLQTELKWTPVRGLDLKAVGSVTSDQQSMEHHIKDDSNQAESFRAMYDQFVMNNNTKLYTDPDANGYVDPISLLPVGGIYDRNDYRLMKYYFRGSFDYNEQFGSDHLISLYGGLDINEENRDQTWFRGWGRQYSMGDEPFFVYENFKRWQQENTKYYEIKTTHKRDVAFFATGSYSYLGKYIVNGTWRYEGSNRMGKARSARWMPTWNAAFAWNMHEESFLKQFRPTLSNAKIRLNYSLTATPPPTYLTNSRLVIGSNTPWRYHTSMQESALYIRNLENSELTYEKKHEFNVGLDVGLFSNRINLVTDYWNRQMFDLIGNITVMGIGGEVDKEGNVAEMKSSGLEFTLTTKNIISKDFSWTTNATFSRLRTEINKLDNNARILDFITGEGYSAEGYDRRALFSIPFVGLTENGFPTFVTNDAGATGMYVYFQDRSNTHFLKYEGPSEPTLTGGLGNIFRYRNFRLNVFLTYSFGNVIRLPQVFSSSYNDLSSMPKEFINRWIMPGDENYTNIPAIVTARQNGKINNLRYAYNAYNYSDIRVAKGDYIRLKELSLTYDFSPKMIAPIGLKNLSIKLQGTNPILLYADSKLNGADPEFIQAGGVSHPVPRQYTFTLQLGL